MTVAFKLYLDEDITSPYLQGHRFDSLLKLVLNLLNQVDEASMRNTIRFLQEFQ